MGFWAAYGLNALTVGLGELAVCVLPGLPLLYWAEHTPALGRYLMPGQWPQNLVSHSN